MCISGRSTLKLLEGAVMFSRTCLSYAVGVWVVLFVKLPFHSPWFPSSQTCECDAHNQRFLFLWSSVFETWEMQEISVCGGKKKKLVWQLRCALCLHFSVNNEEV